MDFSAVTYQIGILALTILIGFGAVKLGYIDVKIKDALSKVIVKLVLPCLILSSITSKELEKGLINDILTSFLMSVFCIAVLYFVGVLTAKIFRIPEGTDKVHKLLTCLGNVTFVGYPVITAMYGETGFFYAIMYWLVNDLFLWTAGVFILQGNKAKNRGETAKKLINPLTVTFTVSILMLCFGIKLPRFIGDVVGGMGDLTISLSMIFIGMALADVDVKKAVRKWWIFAVAPIKMVIIPIAFIYIFKAFGIREILLGAIVLEAAMPAQTVLSILANESGADFEYAACGMFVTTLLSLVTLPFVCYMIKLIV